MSTSSKNKIEFQVDMTCNNCVNSISTKLNENSINDFEIDLKSQSVVINSEKTSEELKSIIESTGKRAVIAGQGGLMAAVAMMGGTIGCSIDNKIQGVVRFSQIDENKCVIDGTVDGLSPNSTHGLAIHESGDLSNDCSNVGDHYNPRNTRHGSPESPVRHVGDLGNIESDSNGRAIFKFSDDLIKVWDVIGRSVVIASEHDDLGVTSHPLSSVNGNCGHPLSCGIIARSSGLFQNSKRICACDGVTLWDERDKPLAGEGRQHKSNI